jgi:predicted O-methyltransferase YrrM
LYSAFTLAKKYFTYLFTASNGKGHGIHSPFVFDFIKFVLNDRNPPVKGKEIEGLRKELLQNMQFIDVTDFGAGSAVIKSKSRQISRIAASSLKAKKYSRLLHRIISYYKTKNVLELGTSFGITTAYMAASPFAETVTTMEGSQAIASVAKNNFKSLALKNIKLVEGDFDVMLAELLEHDPMFDLVFLDGNHRREPTLRYYKQILRATSENSIFVFDDIHWSAEMEDAWKEIKDHEAVTLTIDLFFIGLVFFRKDFKVKQHFTIRF